jgi:aryl-alcohol dehydrogenase-like predicted oxidoreductase
MEHRPLGTTGLSVSRVFLGCGSIGGIGSPASTRGLGLSVDEGLEQIEAAVRLGVTVLDTANAYAGGESERTVGKWLAARPDDRVLVATKVGNIAEPGQSDMDLSGPHIARQARASLARLGHIDLYLSHAPDETTPIEETMEAFAELVEAGCVKAIGACNVSVAQLSDALAASERLGLPRYEWVQNEYNLLARDDERALLAVVGDHGLGYTPYSPLAGGVLAGRYRAGEPPPPGSRLAVSPQLGRTPDAATFAGLELMREDARRRGVTMAGLALAWVLSSPHVTAPLVAPRRPEQWEAVTEGLSLCLDPDERDRIGRWFL